MCYWKMSRSNDQVKVISRSKTFSQNDYCTCCIYSKNENNIINGSFIKYQSLLYPKQKSAVHYITVGYWVTQITYFTSSLKVSYETMTMWLGLLNWKSSSLLSCRFYHLTSHCVFENFATPIILSWLLVKKAMNNENHPHLRWMSLENMCIQHLVLGILILSISNFAQLWQVSRHGYISLSVLCLFGVYLSPPPHKLHVPSLLSEKEYSASMTITITMAMTIIYLISIINFE